MDLLRAAILGAAGTPYHDQLFMFDVQLRSDHPARPPKVYYHAFGYRVNPNLYADGNVRFPTLWGSDIFTCNV
jgi:ubiquitin-conjugating enzyme E2 O